MTLTIDLTPHQERRLADQARERGLDASAYARQLLDRLLDEDSLAAWDRDLDALAEGSEGRPVLDAWATTREGIYGEHA